MVYFAPVRKTTPYTRNQSILSIALMLLLAWMTVCTPVVFAAQRKAEAAQNEFAAAAAKAKQARLAKADHQATHQHKSGTDQGKDNDDQSCNPFGNNTEEKAPSSGINSFSEEYIHHTDDIFHAVELFLSHTTFHSATEYISFHGELLCPPPNPMA